MAGEPTLSDKEIYEMERKGEEILADMSMTEELRRSEVREEVTKNRLIKEVKGKGKCKRGCGFLFYRRQAPSSRNALKDSSAIRIIGLILVTK